MLKIDSLQSLLSKVIGPATSPIAVWFLKDLDCEQAEYPRPVSVLGKPVRPCEAVHYARHLGVTTLMMREDFSSECPIGPFAFGVLEPTDSWLNGDLALGVCTDSQEIAQKMVRGIPRLKMGKYKAFAFAPLEKATPDFDLLVIYCNSVQTMKLGEVTRWTNGDPITPNITTRAECANSIIQPILRDKCLISIPCGGDRAWGGTQDSELSFSAPREKLEDIMIGLAGYQRSHSIMNLGEETFVAKNYRKMAEAIEPLLHPTLSQKGGS